MSLRQEIRDNILSKIFIARILKIEDRRINVCNARIKKYLENHPEKGYKNAYEYLKNTKANDVFDDMREAYYKDLKYDLQKGNLNTENYKQGSKDRQ